MRKLSLSILSVLVLVFTSGSVVADSPHGKDFKLSCNLCHSSNGWKLDKSIYAYDHNTSAFPLAGQHQALDCRQCHKTLVFSEAKTACIDCHTDMHNLTVGPDCGRCHTSNSWIVENINEIHQRSRFPLVGPHYTAECTQCHPSASSLRFDPRGVECYDCHQTDYLNASSPNHVQGGFSKNCIECHALNSFTWTGAGFNHSTFPLTEGHANVSCTQCHVNGNYSNTSRECVSCHLQNYNSTTNPNHIAASIPSTCGDCHTTTPGWKPAEYRIHDAQYFPVYSGKHVGTWSSCADCHSNPSSFKTFSCIDCHAHNLTDMNNGHTGVGGYTYVSMACYQCHPTGSKEGSFNHSTSIFPLTGAHITTACTDCHVNGFNNTPTDCSACHLPAYNQSANPNHVALAIPKTCADCHSTNPGWKPAIFPIHANYYPLTGAHTATDCISCHPANNYNNTPNVCMGCHQNNYNQTTNPNHAALQIPTTCETCHTTIPGWKPATFAIHVNYYPLTGAHTTVDCNSCHPGGIYNNTPVICVGCHLNNYNQTTNPNHAALQIPTTCETCHTTNPGWHPATFAIHNNYYSLTGAHTNVDCNSCHPGGIYTNTPNTCVGCHLANYNQTTNPNHTAAGIPTTCETCHTTNPGWTPATFAIHNNYYPLTGAHATVDCNSCHQGNYNNPPNTCVGCHLTNYNQTNNPNHGALGIPTTCVTCHTTNPGWTPATFPIHGNYYPLTGAHTTVDCNACHQGNYSNPPNTCVGCHLANYNQTTNPNHGALGIPTTCATCHTTNPGWTPATFPIHGNYYPLTGAHSTVDCNACHQGNYHNPPNTCVGCHQANYNQTTNPNHGAIGIPTTCATCHTTNPNWIPATFPIHNNYYVLQGAHLSVACFTCHQGNYNNSIPTTCFGCHQTDYNNTTNPNHAAAQFPTNCEICHTQNAWVPSTFNHDGQYFPIYSGHHNGEWTLCADCHTNPTNFQIFSCIDCHAHNQSAMNNEHDGVPGYVWNSQACYTCHPNGSSGGKMKNLRNIRQQN
ncbi:MAG: hypothetical protein WCI71_06480 [Bacteroidota bacterium]